MRQSALAAQEKRLSRTVLQNIASKQSHADFKPTVLAIYAIVEDKLYKVRFHSLEQYFRSVWGVSRAQVYRFYNCARILHVVCYIMTIIINYNMAILGTMRVSGAADT